MNFKNLNTIEMVQIDPQISQMKFSLASNQRKIFLNGVVDDNMAFEFMYYTSKIKEMDKNLANKEDIYVYVDTPGGSATACFTIVDIIESLVKEGYNVVTINSGCAYSAGMAIALCGSERQCRKRSRYMCHDVAYGTYGFSQNIKEGLEEAEILKQTYYDIITGYSNISKKDLEDWTVRKVDKFFSAQEMFELKGCEVII